MQRLHIYKDDKVPEEIMQNVSDQLPQIRKVPRRLKDHSKEEVETFPKLFDYPKDYVLD